MLANDRRPIPPGTRFDIWRRDGFRCRYCGKHVSEEGVILEIDHVVPVSAGGGDEPDNLLTACRDCNRGKSDSVANLDPWIFNGWGHAEQFALEAQRGRIDYELAVIAEIRALLPFGNDATTAAELFGRMAGRDARSIDDLLALAQIKDSAAASRLAMAREERDRLLAKLAYPILGSTADGLAIFGVDPSADALVRSAFVLLSPDELDALWKALVERLSPEDRAALLEKLDESGEAAS